jgi:L-seryl-tRNA(Ser) seleniumtransferase
MTESGPGQPAQQASRRQVPRTDAVLADPAIVAALERFGRDTVKAAVRGAQEQVRLGRLTPEIAAVATAAVGLLPASATSLREVLNATGVVLHTNLGRAALSRLAVEALGIAAGTVDVELDLDTGARARRGRGTLDALAQALPDAGDVAVVNNGAAAVLLAVTVLAAGREVVVSRGELVEIGDGFRLPDLLIATGARLREVGTTNRTTINDYADAIGPDTGCLLKVHPSNFRITGFTSAAGVSELTRLGPPVVVDVGSGLLRPDPMLPAEPDMMSALRQGAGLVAASGDKLLGGPQAGILAGTKPLIQRCRRAPLARALRVDKLTLAALEATLRTPATPTWRALHAQAEQLHQRVLRLAAAAGGGEPVPSAGAVGGGGAPGLELAGWALALPVRCAGPLRSGTPAVMSRISAGRCLVDPRAVPPERDDDLAAAVSAALAC